MKTTFCTFLLSVLLIATTEEFGLEIDRTTPKQNCDEREPDGIFYCRPIGRTKPPNLDVRGVSPI
jgi:hypothetical protein